MDEENKTVAKQRIYDILEKIAGEDSDLAVRINYCVPLSISIDPKDFKLYIEQNFKRSKFMMDLCIGKSLEKQYEDTGLEDEVLPGVCIDLTSDFKRDVYSCSERTRSLRHYYPQARYGVLLIAEDHIGVKRKTNLDSSKEIDFIEAIGNIIEYEDKLDHVLRSIVEAQLQSSKNLAQAIFGDGKLQSIRKTYS